MRIFPQRRAWWTRAALAAALALLAACSSPPKSATSGPSGVSTDGVGIKYVDHRYIAAQDFVRISEYFTDKENTSGRLIERTDPAERGGYYFIVSLAWHPSVTLRAGTQADVDYIRSDDPNPRHAHFVFAHEAGTFHELLFGLTGKEWPDRNLKIAAYNVTLKDATGKVLASKQSFLWAMPPEPVAAASPAAETTPAKP